MRFMIYGAGGIGGTIGARLSQQNEEVILLARGAHLAALQRDGLHFIAPDGEHHLKLPVIGHPTEHSWQEGDVVLLCVKSQHTAKALEDLRRAAGDQIPVVCIQNGVANEDAALRLFSSVYAVHVYLPAAHLSPGVVITYGHKPGGVLDIGRYPKGADALCEALARAFSRAGFSSLVDPEVMRHKYAKLLTNLNNALQAATLMAEGAAEISSMLQEEALSCYRAAGINYASKEEAQTRRETGLRYAEVPGQTRYGGSSWQSIARHTGDIETDFLNGEIVLLGRRFGVLTPAHLVLQRLGNEMAWRALTPGSIKPSEIMELIETEKARAS